MSCSSDEVPLDVYVTGGPGPANDLTVGEVYSVPYGLPPEVTISGDPPQQVIDFGLPQGEKGDTGSTTDASVAGWISNPTSQTRAELDDWIGYRYKYVNQVFGDGVTNATTAIQSAIDAADAEGGGTVVIPPGDYVITAPIVLKPQLRLLGYGATIHRAGTNGMMLINWEPGDSTTTLYNGYSGITVQGITLDGHAGDVGWPNEDSPNQQLSFSHCQDITVRDCRLLRGHTNHALEFNAVDGALAENTWCEGWEPNGITSREAIQIDCAVAGPGAHDNTVAKNITIRACRTQGSASLPAWASGIGTHTAAPGDPYTNIRIEGNTVIDSSFSGIRAFSWHDSRIEGNHVVTSQPMEGGIAQTECVNMVVANNNVKGYGRFADAGGGITADVASRDLNITGNEISLVVDGITGAMSNALVASNVIADTQRYSVSLGGSDNMVTGNFFRRTNGASVVRFYGTTVTGNSVVGNHYRPGGDPPGAYAVSAAGGQTVYIMANDFTGVTNLTSGVANTDLNKI